MVLALMTLLWRLDMSAGFLETGVWPRSKAQTWPE
jgi:hypothetical protein